MVPQTHNLIVGEGDLVNVGDPLTEGSVDLRELYRLRGREVVQKYILKEIQHIYTSQGQKLNDKHIEIIIRQMFSRIMVKDPGDTELLPGEIDHLRGLKENVIIGRLIPAGTGFRKYYHSKK